MYQGPAGGPYSYLGTEETWSADAIPTDTQGTGTQGTCLWLQGLTHSDTVDDVTLTVTHKYNDSGDADAQKTESKSLTIAKIVIAGDPNITPNAGQVVPVQLSIYPTDLTDHQVAIETDLADPNIFKVSLTEDMTAPIDQNTLISPSSIVSTTDDLYIQMRKARTDHLRIKLLHTGTGQPTLRTSLGVSTPIAPAFSREDAQSLAAASGVSDLSIGIGGDYAAIDQFTELEIELNLENLPTDRLKVYADTENSVPIAVYLEDENGDKLLQQPDALLPIDGRIWIKCFSVGSALLQIEYIRDNVTINTPTIPFQVADVDLACTKNNAVVGELVELSVSRNPSTTEGVYLVYIWREDGQPVTAELYDGNGKIDDFGGIKVFAGPEPLPDALYAKFTEPYNAYKVILAWFGPPGYVIPTEATNIAVVEIPTVDKSYVFMGGDATTLSLDDVVALGYGELKLQAGTGYDSALVQLLDQTDAALTLVNNQLTWDLSSVSAPTEVRIKLLEDEQATLPSSLGFTVTWSPETGGQTVVDETIDLAVFALTLKPVSNYLYPEIPVRTFLGKYPETLTTGTVTLKAVTGQDYVKVYSDFDLQNELPLPVSWSISNMPDKIYLAGVEGDTDESVQLQLFYSE